MDTVGERIRYWRRRRGGMSQRTLAELAGLSQAYISQVESGVKSLHQRHTQVAIAQALNISVAQLIGHPTHDADPVRDRSVVHVPAIRDVLIELSFGERRQPRRDADALRAALVHVTDLRNAADYERIAPLLPDLLVDVAAHGRALSPELVQALFTARFALRTMGYLDLAREAAQIGVQVAREYEHPVWTAQAVYSLVQAFPPESAVIGERLMAQAADELQGVPGRDAQEMYGCLHLLAALQAAVTSRPELAWSHLDEARDTAASTGEPLRISGLTAGWNGNWFGPTQALVWEGTIAAELGDTSRALAVADHIDLTALPVPNRHVYYWTDQARTLAAIGKDHEAMHALARAERAAPQHFRFSPATRDLASTLVARAKRRAVATELVHLARTLGLPL